MTDRTKRVILVRHAESEQNVAISQFKSGNVFAVFPIMYQGEDADVSETGNDQIATKAKELKDSDFLGKHGVQLVGYSPYKRAKLTCEGLFGSSGLPTKCLDFFYERTVLEYAFSGSFWNRVEQLKDWLGQQEQECIVLVGHSQFFRRLFGGKDDIIENVGHIFTRYRCEAREFVKCGEDFKDIH